jgi:hypothetical protein
MIEAIGTWWIQSVILNATLVGVGVIFAGVCILIWLAVFAFHIIHILRK